MSSSRNFVNPNQKYERVVVLVDMDCFFCQVEEKLNPELKGKPVAVVQYNNWNVSGGGGIIAVNYMARDQGVTRHMRGDEAREKCPEIELVKVPNIREKADTSRYREAGKEVADVLQTFTTLLERASVDEAYLDITSEVLKRMEHVTKGDGQIDPNLLVNTFAVGYEHIGDFIKEILTSMGNDNDGDEFYEDGLDSSTIRKSNFKLLIGATIAGEMRAKIKEATGYECSAGIAHNKVLAKLVCGVNKPNKQTVLPLREIPPFFRTLPVGKIKGLGGKFGEDICEMLKIKFLGDLKKFSEEELQRKFTEKNGSWLYQICRGIDLESVTPRFYSKSIGCCKRFPGKNAITGYKTLKHWITELVTEIVERLEKDVEENNRLPKQSVISFTLEMNGEDVAQSRSTPISSTEQNYLENIMMDVLKRNIEPFFKKDETTGLLHYPIKYMGISAGKFITIGKKTVTLETMFAKQALKATTTQKPENETSFAPTCSSTQNLQDSKQKPDKENSLEKMFEKQAQQFKEKPTEVKSSTKTSFFQNYFAKSKTEQEKLVENVLENEKNVLILEEKENLDEKEDIIKNDVKILEEKENSRSINLDEKEDILENDVIILEEENKNILDVDKNYNNILKESDTTEDENSDFKKSQEIKDLEDWFLNDPEIEAEKYNETEKKALEKLYEVQSTLKNVDIDIEKERNSLKRLMGMKNEFTCFKEPTALPKEPVSIESRKESFVKCDQCGKNIIDNEKAIQSHKDFHTALEVSREQRETFRKEVKNKILSPKQNPPAKKAKFDKTLNSTISSIKSFFESKESGDESKIDQEQCQECGRFIDTDKVTEHADYHFARKIQIQMNSNDIKMVSKTKKPQAKAKGKDSKSGPSVMMFFSQPSTSKTSIN